MDQQQLSNRLEDRVADVPVGAPPIDAMRAAVRRRRNRMTVVGAAAAAAVIAVPESWGTNDTKCGTPQEDTVVIDQGYICQALIPRPVNVESVTVRWSDAPEGSEDWTEFEVDGFPALRSPVVTVSDPTAVSTA